jgi:hypothetical protein
MISRSLLPLTIEIVHKLSKTLQNDARRIEEGSQQAIYGKYIEAHSDLQ